MKRSFLVVLMALVTVAGMAQRPHDNRGRGDRGPGAHGRMEQKHIMCATPEELSMTLRVLEDLSFDDKRVEVAQLAVMLGHFCTDDLARMAKKFSFDDNRKKFLVYAYDYCEDPQNYFSLHRVFEFRNNFDEMMESLDRGHHRR